MMTKSFEVPLSRADAKTFTGEAHSGLMGAAESEVPIKLYFVSFEPGSRTFWHAHSGGQILVVTEGTCLIQRWGREIEEVPAGQSVRFESDEKHWHGAPMDGSMTHIAINLEPSRTDWFEEAVLD